VDVAGGRAGPKAPDYLKPGEPGKPNPAYMNFSDYGKAYVTTNVQKPGAPAQSPDPVNDQGNSGKIDVSVDPMLWIQTKNAAAILRYADDVYLIRHYDDALSVFRSYSDSLKKAAASEVDDGRRTGLVILAQHADRQILQITNGLDFLWSTVRLGSPAFI
jgi:hypothetical protein